MKQVCTFVRHSSKDKKQVCTAAKPVCRHQILFKMKWNQFVQLRDQFAQLAYRILIYMKPVNAAEKPVFTAVKPVLQLLDIIIEDQISLCSCKNSLHGNQESFRTLWNQFMQFSGNIWKIWNLVFTTAKPVCTASKSVCIAIRHYFKIYKTICTAVKRVCTAIRHYFKRYETSLCSRKTSFYSTQITF